MKKLFTQLDQFLRNPLSWLFLLLVGVSAFIVGHDFRRPAPVATSGFFGAFGVCGHDAGVLNSAQAAGFVISDIALPETSKPYILIEKEWVPERHSICVTKATLYGYYLTDVHEMLYELSALKSINVDMDDPSMRPQNEFRVPHLRNHGEPSDEPKRPIARFSHG
jgi:hypothetical protein